MKLPLEIITDVSMMQIYREILRRKKRGWLTEITKSEASVPVINLQVVYRRNTCYEVLEWISGARRSLQRL